MKHLFLFSLLLSSISCSQKNQEIPFDLKDRIYVPVTIDGKEYAFLFDTGTSTTQLSEALVKELKATATDSMPIMVFQKRTIKNCPLYDEISFRIGDQSVKSRFHSEAHDSVNIIGMDIISQLHWQFNFRTSRLQVSKKEILLSPEDSVQMALHYQGPIMTVPVTLDDSSFHFIFDTGMSSGGINEEFMLFLNKYPDTWAGQLQYKNRGGSAYYSDRHRILILVSMLLNNSRLAYPTLLFDIHPENELGEQDILCIGMKFIAKRYAILNINPEKSSVTLAKREGECAEFEEQQKAKFDKMIKMALKEQKQRSSQ